MHDSFDEPDFYAIILDLAVGGDILDRVMRRHSYSELDARTSMNALLSAVAHCHSHKIAHRDIKPENVLFLSNNDETTLKLSDFGFSVRSENDHCLLTQCGSPFYVAPEILHGVPYGVKADCWSVGVVAYILLSGSLPFYGDTSKDVFRAVKKGRFELLSEEWDGVSPEAKDLVTHLLQSNPDRRMNAEEGLNHKWMSIESDRLNNIALNLKKLRSFNAKRKLRQVVFELIVMNKLTSLGSRFRSQLAEG